MAGAVHADASQGTADNHQGCCAHIGQPPRILRLTYMQSISVQIPEEDITQQRSLDAQGCTKARPARAHFEPSEAGSVKDVGVEHGERLELHIEPIVDGFVFIAYQQFLNAT